MNSRTLRSLVLCVLGVLATSRCSWNRARTNIQDMYGRIDKIEPGQTMLGEITDIMGSPPNNIILTEDGQVLLYTFGDAKTKSFNLLLVNFSKTNVGIDSALVIVGSDGVVRQVSVSNNSRHLGWEFWPFGGDQ